MDYFRKNIEAFGGQLSRRGLVAKRLEKLRGFRPDGIVIAGMGGSGLAGEIIANLDRELKLAVPIRIWKDYGVPRHYFKKPLYIFVSFSGNTEETLSGFKATASSSRIAAVTTGGKLMAAAERAGIPLVLFDPEYLTPRQSTGKMFYSLVEILRAVQSISSVKHYTGLRASSLEKAGKLLARKIGHRLIVAYTSTRNQHIGYIWKITLNENAKTPAFANVIPEMNHNEIVGFDRTEKENKSVVAILMEDAADHERNKKRFLLTKKILRSRGVDIVSLPLSGADRLEKTWKAAILANWTSYYLAKLLHKNPATTPVIAALKKALSK